MQQLVPTEGMSILLRGFQGEMTLETKRELSCQARLAECPNCRRKIEFKERLLIGETVVCDSCGVDLEVADPDPPSLILRARVETREESQAG